MVNDKIFFWVKKQHRLQILVYKLIYIIVCLTFTLVTSLYRCASYVTVYSVNFPKVSLFQTSEWLDILAKMSVVTRNYVYNQLNYFGYHYKLTLSQTNPLLRLSGLCYMTFSLFFIFRQDINLVCVQVIQGCVSIFFFAVY